MVEASVTSDVLSALPEGTRADGLQWRMKSPGSTARKIADRVTKTGRPACEIASQFTDILRYTVVTRTADELVSGAHRFVDNLTSSGWKVVEADHSYFDGAAYKGLHLLARHSSGEVVEMQVHSEVSVEAKNLNHAEYEIMRDPDRPAGERIAARQRMIDRSAALATPRGLHDDMELGGVVVETTTR